MAGWRRHSMPRYEFLCETCKKPFELVMTITEREKAKPKTLQGHEDRADVEEELRVTSIGKRGSVCQTVRVSTRS
jgi:predicted nucleic acid-binding Zn ribbon protein